MRNGWDFGDFEITKREILASVSIIAIMLLIGSLLSAKISNWQMDRNEKYNKAVKIENNTDLFRYGMDTNVGNAFVYGELKAVDTVTYPEIGGKYMYVEKVKEKYTKHTRRVKHKSGDHTYYTTETYWTWNEILDKMIRTFEYLSDESCNYGCNIHEPNWLDVYDQRQKEIKEGLMLFAEYFQALWW